MVRFLKVLLFNNKNMEELTEDRTCQYFQFGIEKLGGGDYNIDM